MPIVSTTDSTSTDDRAGRCYGCFRPQEDCFCDQIPTIDNRTAVLILQHKREQFHPFGTARIVQRALRNSELRVGLDGRFQSGLNLQPGAGLLYPGDEAELLDDLPAERRPRQLVILDGTWHHAKTMLRDLPELRTLPRYKLAPTAPSRYGFRREPRAECISTVEATIAALRGLEPELDGLDALMDAFLAMVNRQLSRAKRGFGRRLRLRPKRTFKNIPRALVGDLKNIVVTYGESAPHDPTNPTALRPPVHWVAERLGTDERFSCLIEPPCPVDGTLLSHWQLTRGDFVNAVTLTAARAAWTAFLQPTDVLTAFNKGVAQLAEQLGGDATSCLVLKSVDFGTEHRYATLDQWLAVEEIVVGPRQLPGRAGTRLANLAAFVRHLHALSNEAVCR